MNFKISVAAALVLLPSLAFCGAGDVARLNKSYASARSESERMRVAVDAIESGVVCKYCNVSELDKVFSTRFSRKDKNTKGLDALYRGVVYFDSAEMNASQGKAKNLPSPAAANRRGWYLWFKFDEAGNVVDYYISNVHK
ncbi:hypothetical protein [Lysobacter sp. Root559]|uniref:hypothetical protein n=1 Tax=Lysobacter sp. Root559 TaxID=1736559 RepID=UPI0012F7DA13|nr:hypothetical protein [Lysobacter sp. Root559]